jgi:hypothetical protein
MEKIKTKEYKIKFQEKGIFETLSEIVFNDLKDVKIISEETYPNPKKNYILRVVDYISKWED